MTHVWPQQNTPLLELPLGKGLLRQSQVVSGQLGTRGSPSPDEHAHSVGHQEGIVHGAQQLLVVILVWKQV